LGIIPSLLINIPNSLRRINDWAFDESLQTTIHLHDGIESIGEAAFARCIFTNFRVPPLIIVIPNHMLYNCRSTFSLELPHKLAEIGKWAFRFCHCLRNVAFPPNVVCGITIFFDEDLDMNTDLQELFGSEAAIISALQHRFDGDT
jgi:hypothetical protein